MIFFRNDYGQGAHPKVLDALIKTNEEYTDGYCLDPHCEHAAQMIRDLTGIKDCHVHMMVGGTPANVTTIASALRPYEAVVSPRTGHIYAHECGAVELSGHKIIPMNGEDGKLTPALIEEAWLEYEDEHTVIPKMAYISNSTELGTVYTKAELEALNRCCREHGMYLFMDGARLGAALASEGADLTLADIARLVDVFYIGGTKNGALLGEAVVILSDDINDHYRWYIKQNCGMLAKGRIIGVEFEALLEGGKNSVFFEIASYENKMAKKLREGLSSFGYSFVSTSITNLIFPILPRPMVKELEKDFFFHEWASYGKDMLAIRLVTSWGTRLSDVDAFLAAVKRLR